MVVRVKCEGEWNSIIILLPETFVVLTADQFVGGDDGLLEQQKQDSRVCRRSTSMNITCNGYVSAIGSKDSHLR